MTINILSPDALVGAVLADHKPFSIIDARPYAHYTSGHIPGAVWMGWEYWCELPPAHAGATLAQPGYWGVLKDLPSSLLAGCLQQLGLSSNRPIIVYADGPASKGRDGRVAWMLLYWGASQVFLLNGGWHSWLQHGGKSEATIPQPDSGCFQVAIQASRRVRLSHLKHVYITGQLPCLLDARSRPEYEGHLYPYQPRRGRVPHAIHFPADDLFDEAGNFLSKERYLTRLPPAARNADRLIAYCEVGVRSCIVALLHEAYTGQVVANFDGSIMEWALDPELPISC